MRQRIKEMHEKESKRIFVDWVKAGNKLTYNELRELKQEDWKIEYIKQQLLEDEIIRELLNEQ